MEMIQLISISILLMEINFIGEALPSNDLIIIEQDYQKALLIASEENKLLVKLED